MNRRLFAQMLDGVTCGDCIDIMDHMPPQCVDFHPHRSALPGPLPRPDRPHHCQRQRRRLARACLSRDAPNTARRCTMRKLLRLAARRRVSRGGARGRVSRGRAHRVPEALRVERAIPALRAQPSMPRPVRLAFIGPERTASSRDRRQDDTDRAGGRARRHDRVNILPPRRSLPAFVLDPDPLSAP